LVQYSEQNFPGRSLTQPALLPPSPPQHLPDDPTSQATVNSLGDSIRVDAPFDVNKFELLLSDHPNQPFVQSVMKGLREGFWPSDDCEWKVEVEEIVDNYPTDPQDLDQIHAFRDEEIIASRWSDALPDSNYCQERRSRQCSLCGKTANRVSSPIILALVSMTILRALKPKSNMTTYLPLDKHFVTPELPIPVNALSPSNQMSLLLS
jgi:hypothetical protein